MQDGRRGVGAVRAAGSPCTPAPVLLKHGWDVPDPAFVQANIRSMERLPFDGVVVAIPSSAVVMGDTPVPLETLTAELAPLAQTEPETLVHNFVIVYGPPATSYTGSWGVPRANLANLARAAREAGLEGIVLDTEDYGVVIAPPAPGRLPGRDEAASAFERGRAVMASIVGTWSSATVISLLGPWVSDPATASTLTRSFPYNDTAMANRHHGPFFMGMLEASLGTPATLVDGGGPLFAARTDRDFTLAYDWMKRGMARRSEVTPTHLRDRYEAEVDVGFGVYDSPSLGVPMDAETWSATLVNAMRRTDRYVWAYTEAHDWWGVGHPVEPVPDRWVDATERAAAMTSTSTCGSTASDREDVEAGAVTR